MLKLFQQIHKHVNVFFKLTEYCKAKLNVYHEIYVFISQPFIQNN